jgi:hypothetical protein
MSKLNFKKTWPELRQIPGDKGRCFILGSAPSLENEPLELLKGERVFVCNKAWLALKLLNLDKANWIVYTGLGSWENDLADLKDYAPSGIRFYSDLITESSAFKISQQTFSEDYYVFDKRRLTVTKETANIGLGFFPDNYQAGWGSALSVILDAMVIAYFMGFTEICLLGVDLDYTSNRFYFFEADEFLQKNNAPTLRDKTYIGLINLARNLNERGVIVKNLSRGFKQKNYAKFDSKHTQLIDINTRLEDVVSGIVRHKNIGMIYSTFHPLDKSDIRLISKARSLCDKLVLCVSDSEQVPVLGAIRGVNDVVVCDNFEHGVKKLRKQYPNDRIRVVHDQRVAAAYTDEKVSIYPVKVDIF